MNNAPGKAVIEEVALEMGIDPAFVEKDWYVVQLISKITNADLFGAQLIFAGGTALSKAHRLLQRFSEDIDFRLILPPNTSASRSQQRKLLSAIRERLYQLITAHFPIDAVKWKSRDENKYFAFEIDYPSVVASSDPLRPHLQIEFTEATLTLPRLTRPVASFIAELTGTGPEVQEVVCVDPVENAADKLSALIWRVPDRARLPEDDDPDLVRHIHDLAALQPYVISHADFRQLAMDAIRQDNDRCEKITGLPLNKKFQLLQEILITDAEYRTEYTRFVQGMSYAIGGVPTYDEAITKLKTLIDYIDGPDH
ncbi:MAG TPA: nucleotidyl transferase AbiEii/AbiGii toxin family protein [Puia sp.]|jgi:predicted nucleotidyltransferase component of viral defense system|nr:nucleotidyl transferase AbiEii/AbiGii toxin family protein [Puia sp.]